MKKNFLLYSIAFLFFVYACTSAVKAPSVTVTAAVAVDPTVESSKTPTQIKVKPTETQERLSIPLPSGVPATEWQGIPIMPGAIAGEGNDQGYSFTIQSTLEEIQEFYEGELTALGWELLAAGQGETNSILLIFTKGNSTASLAIMPQADGIIYVMMVK